MDKEKKGNKKTLFIILLIILLLLIYLLGYKMGKIGYNSNGDVPAFGEKMKIIEVSENDLELTNNSELNIFANEKFNGESIIAPNSYGQYKFVVKNIIDEAIKYNIKFSDVMTNPVNMKYRLKIDNIYIRGNEEKFIDIEDLSVDEIVVLKDSTNVFTLEWYWADSDLEDTYVGSLETDQYYTLNLSIDAEQHLK